MSAGEVLIVVLGLVAGYWLVSFIMRSVRRRSSADGDGTNKKYKAADKEASERREGDQESQQESTQARTGPTAWFEVLGVGRYATGEEVRSAYRKLVSQYHPDKVAALGPELRELATRKSQEITSAYREGMRLKGGAE